VAEEPHPSPDTPIDLLRGFTLGVVAGSRSLLPLALLSRRISNEGPDIGDGGWLLDVFADRRTAMALSLAALGELVLDQLPLVPSRTEPLPLMGRVIAGGLVASVQNLAEGRRSDSGALVGSLGAVVGSLVGYWWRTRLPAPSALLALTEDAAAVALGVWATRR
jgi:uncharacterized membrane protein